jgi:prolyl oligopeptidase
MRSVPFLARAVAGLAFATFGAAAQDLPRAAVRNVDDSFFGTTVTDPYRYFEDVKDPQVAAWMKAHSDHAHKALTHIAGRDALLAKLVKYDSSASSRVTGATRAAGDVWFYEKRGARDNQFKLYTRRGLKGPEVVLVDPDAIEKSTGKPHAINYFSPSPDGRYVAYGLSKQGSESADLYVLDVKTRHAVGKPITRADFGYPDWAPDSRSFQFVRLQELKPGMPPTEKYQRSAVLHFDIKSAQAGTKSVFDFQSPGVTMTPAEIPFTATTHDGHWVLGIAANGTQRELKVFAAPLADVAAGNAQWKRIVDTGDDVTGLAYMNDALYLNTHKDASRWQIKKLDLNAPDMAAAPVVVPQSERVITGLAAASDALYIEARDGNVKHLYKLGYGKDATLAPVKLPIEGAFQLSDSESNASATDPRLPGAVIDLQGWTQARQIYTVAANGDVANTGMQPVGPYDAPTDVETHEVLVKSHDGAMVPLSIIHRKGVKLDGSNPTLLYGYGSYGITEEPYFSISRLAWMDAGGVFAVANPRGTSVFGEDWYRGGFQTTKPNTWKDFIACAEYLVSRGYTRPAKLGILGGSAGGILVGRAMTERPDLFAAVISGAGALDTLRAEFTPNGVPNIPEFGSVKTEDGFKALREMSTLEHVKDGTAYPALLLTGGINDPRVEIWESTKVAARVLAASTSGKPVLLRLDYDAGHGIGNTKKQQLEERADMYAFLLWQMGVKGFELKQ